MAERASRALRDVREVARDTAENVGDRATAMAERASDGLHDAKHTARISAARDAAMGNVATIASDTAAAIVQKLTGRAVDAAELEAAQAARGS